MADQVAHLVQDDGGDGTDKRSEQQHQQHNEKDDRRRLDLGVRVLFAVRTKHVDRGGGRLVDGQRVEEGLEGAVGVHRRVLLHVGLVLQLHSRVVGGVQVW